MNSQETFLVHARGDGLARLVGTRASGTRVSEVFTRLVVTRLLRGYSWLFVANLVCGYSWLIWSVTIRGYSWLFVPAWLFLAKTNR